MCDGDPLKAKVESKLVAAVSNDTNIHYRCRMLKLETKHAPRKKCKRNTERVRETENTYHQQTNNEEQNKAK